MPKLRKIKNYQRYHRELVDIIARIKNPKLLDEFLLDLFTPQEIDEVVTRLQLVKMLRNGVPQREVAQRLGISTNKVTRGSRMLLNKYGGFNKVFKLLKVK